MASLKKKITCSSFGFIFTVIAVVVLLLIPTIVKYIVHDSMPLLPQNPSYPMYRDLDIPIKQKFYFFNVTNPREVELGQVPILQEIGPFVYSMNISKKDIEFDKNQSTLSYREWKTFHFERELSSHDLNLTITTLNMPLVGMYSFFPTLNPFIREAAKVVISRLRPGFFIQASIRELMFDGKKNALSCISHIFSPKVQPDCYFAYFRNQNVSNDGLFKVATGKNDVPKINALLSLNNKTHLDFWDGEPCNRIGGASNGELFPPLDVVTAPRKAMRFFRTDFCRTFEIYLNETGVISPTGGMIVDRFRTLPNSFDNATLNPENKCYQPNRNKTSSPNDQTFPVSFSETIKFLKKEGFYMEAIEMLLGNITLFGKHKPEPVKVEEHPSGVFSLAACHDDLPLFISWPHFMDADPSYQQAIQGLKPNFEKHQTYLNLEPNTGTPIDFIARLQVNAEIDPKFSLFPKLKRLMFPILWQEFSIHVSDEIAATIRYETSTLKIYAFGSALFVGLVGVALLIYSGTLALIDCHHARLQNKDDEGDEDALIDNQDTSNNNNIIT